MSEAEREGSAHADVAAAGAVTFAFASGPLDPRAAAYFEKQSRLAELEIAELEREERVRHWSLRVRHISDVMKLSFEVAFALGLFALFAAASAMIWTAARSHGLVIEPFQVPQSYVQRGLTGQAMAARLQDKLAKLQDETDSLRPANSFANNWGDDIRIEIPDTGVSVGEINRYLRAWLGRETHISGEIWQTAGGVVVATRAGTGAGESFAGQDSDLDKLLDEAALSIYEKTQPYRYAIYQLDHWRPAEVVRVVRRMIGTAPRREKAWAYTAWSNIPENDGNAHAALAMNRLAIALDAENALAWLNYAGDYYDLDGEEEELRGFRRTVALARSGWSGLNPAKAAPALLTAQSSIYEVQGDFAADLAVQRKLQDLPDYGGTAANAAALAFLSSASLHDARAAEAERRQAAASKDDQGGYPVFLQLQPVADSRLGSWQRVVADRAALLEYTAEGGLRFPGYAGLLNARLPAAAYALALAHSGALAAARKAVDLTPLDCDACLRARAQIAALSGNRKRAEFWFLHAVQHAPSIPFGDTEWGGALLASGDVDAAIAHFRIAHAKGPHFADPLEMWGEALIAKNRSDLALAKFEEAARYAPNWGRLRLKWGEALWWCGRKDEARAQFLRAASLNLIASERSELARMNALAGTNKGNGK